MATVHAQLEYCDRILNCHTILLSAFYRVDQFQSFYSVMDLEGLEVNMSRDKIQTIDGQHCFVIGNSESVQSAPPGYVAIWLTRNYGKIRSGFAKTQ